MQRIRKRSTFLEAKRYFEGLFPKGADTYQNSNGDLIWNLKDTLGVSQGQAVLKQVTGTTADGRIAEIEVPVSVRPLTSIVFVPKSAIPLNDSYWDITTCDAQDRI